MRATQKIIIIRFYNEEEEKNIVLVHIINLISKFNVLTITIIFQMMVKMLKKMKSH